MPWTYTTLNFKKFLARSRTLCGIPFTVFRNRWGSLDIERVSIHSIVISMPLLNAHIFIVLQTLSVSSFLLLLVIWFQILRGFSFCDSYPKSDYSIIWFLPSVLFLKENNEKDRRSSLSWLPDLVLLIPTCFILKVTGLCGSTLAFQSRAWPVNNWHRVTGFSHGIIRNKFFQWILGSQRGGCVYSKPPFPEA